jgi:hypothetical protein
MELKFCARCFDGRGRITTKHKSQKKKGSLTSREKTKKGALITNHMKEGTSILEEERVAPRERERERGRERERERELHSYCTSLYLDIEKASWLATIPTSTPAVQCAHRVKLDPHVERLST